MNYIAYTIGPIYETIFHTLNKGDKTRRLKAGSYFFSYFMKKLLSEIATEFKILVPYAGEDALTKTEKIGFFHDRFIAISMLEKELIEKRFEEALHRVYDSLATEIGNGYTAQEVASSMENHLLVASSSQLKQIDENAIVAINTILDSMELERRVVLHPGRSAIRTYQDKAVEEKKERVKTLEEIAKPMNYYAVVTADGDQLGKKIRAIATEDPSKMRELSYNLYRFFMEEEGVYGLTHHTFKGELIYAGGDDVLAFLPVKVGEQSCFDYVRQLQKRFETYMGEESSLSFGIKIVSYKYPLRNAIMRAFELLGEAKALDGSNKIAIEVTKRSGQTMHTIHTLSHERYRYYEKLVKLLVLQKKIAIPHALHHTLSRYKDVIVALYQTPHEGASLDALFATIFNDERSEAVQNGLEAVKSYIEYVAPQTPQAFNQLFSDLSIIKFLREDRK